MRIFTCASSCVSPGWTSEDPWTAEGAPEYSAGVRQETRGLESTQPMPPKIAVVPKKKAKKPVAVAAKKKAPVAAKKKAVSPEKKKAPKAAPATWMRTKSKVAMPDGKKKTLFKHSVTGELRVCKMVLRGGKKVASYVKVPGMRGGDGDTIWEDIQRLQDYPEKSQDLSWEILASQLDAEEVKIKAIICHNISTKYTNNETLASIYDKLRVSSDSEALCRATYSGPTRSPRVSSAW